MKIKEIHVEYFYTRQPAVYESERVTIGFTMEVDLQMLDHPDLEAVMDTAVDHCMSVVHKRLGLVKEEQVKQPEVAPNVTASVPGRRRRGP